MWSQHGANELAPALRPRGLVDRLRNEISNDPEFFQRVVKEQMLSRPCVIRLLMTPDTDFVDKETQLEKEKLTVIHQALSDTDKSEIRAKVSSNKCINR
jgi:Zn-dependent M16 (insulinase) family peptidase